MYSSEARTVQLLVQNIQLRVGVVNDLVHLSIECTVFVCQGLGQVFLVDSVIRQQLGRARKSGTSHLLRRLVAPEG